MLSVLHVRLEIKFYLILSYLILFDDVIMFRITDPLLGESIAYWWIPLTEGQW